MRRVPQRPTVVLGEFCAVLRLGLRAVLAENGHRVLDDGAPDADVVLLDLDDPRCTECALRLLATRPGVRVIGCSADRAAMRVFGDGTPDERPLEVPALLSAIARS